MTTTNNLKPIEEVIDNWATNLTEELTKWRSAYYDVEKKLRKEWVDSGKEAGEYWYSKQFANHRDRFGSYGSTALKLGINAAKKKIRKDGEKKLANIVKKCEVIGGIKEVEWAHVGGKYGEVEGWILGNDGRWLHVQTILAGGYNIQCLHLRFLCKVVKNH